MEIIIKDTFKIIPNTNGNYSCDINGNIRSNERFSNEKRKFKINSRILISFINNKGYAIVYLRINGKTEDWLVHRLVAKTWIPNPNNFPIINHKDNNPLNNSVENLEWCTYSYNILYAEKQGRRPCTEKMKAVRCVPSIWLYKPVSQYSLDGKYLRTYCGVMVAARSLPSSICKNIHSGSGNIIACCKGYHKQAYGYIWKYDEEFIDKCKV